MPSDDGITVTTVESPEAVNAAARTAEAEQAETEVVDGNHDEQQEQEQPRKHGSRFEQRISELTKEKYRYKDEAEDLRAEVERLRARTEGKSTPEHPTTAADTRPKPLSTDPKYKTYEEFTKDLAEWKTEQVLAKNKAAETQRAQEDQLKANLTAFNRQITEAREKYEDWDEVRDAAKDISIPKVAELAVIELDNGADVLYYLAKNPDAVEKLGGMSELKAVQEIGRISDKLASETTTAPDATQTPVSKAPAPLKPVGGNSTRAVAKSPSEMTAEEYRWWREKPH